MGDNARWNLSVSKELDVNLRTVLASLGGKKGDLSEFVEKAVARELLLYALNGAEKDEPELSDEEAMRLANAEIAAFRKENPHFWDRDRWAGR